MRLIPEYLYEKLHQDNQPRAVDFGDKSNILLSTINTDVKNILIDDSRPIEERIRLFNARTLKRLINKNQLTVGDGPADDAMKTQELAGEIPIVFNNKSSTSIKTPIESQEQPQKDNQINDNFLAKSNLVSIDDVSKDAETHDARGFKKKKHERSEKPASHSHILLPTYQQDKDTEFPEDKKHASLGTFPLVSSIFPSISSKHTNTPARKPHDDNLAVTLSDQFKATDDKSEKRALLKRILHSYFEINSDDNIIFRDDGITRLRGASLSKIINFLVPSRNIHPKAKPAGFAAIAEVLREENLLNHEFFPNENLTPVFDHYMKKKTAYHDKIRAASSIHKQILDLKLNFDDVANGKRNWQTID